MSQCQKNRSCLSDDGHPGLCRLYMMGEGEGWRAFKVIGPPDSPRLMSAYGHTKRARDSVWPTGDWMRARCPNAPNDPVDAAIFYASHHTPDPECSCGIYSADSRETLHKVGGYHAYTADLLTVTGRVGLSGRVIEAWCGQKAEKARVLELFVPSARWQYAEGLRDAYDVPVNLDNTWLSVVSEHAVRLERR